MSVNLGKNELKTNNYGGHVDIKKRPLGLKVNLMAQNKKKSIRPKKFLSMESLWFEEQRLATFIDWPVTHITDTELAAEGFYYLRTKDHCACVFCRGIIGAWEVGDTPRGEHKKHFPKCPFVEGKVTANVPIPLGRILNRFPRETLQEDARERKSEDVCGTGKQSVAGMNHGILTYLYTCKDLGDQTEMSRPQDNKGPDKLSLQNLGFKEYCGPKKKEFLTPESRVKSFKSWPERVEQRPEQLAEAGFYYCGLSDHVRCFHCGNGLRNWESGDDPWQEHARWYPECNYLILTKGKDYIDTVQRENPPADITCMPPTRKANCSTSACSCSLTEEEIDQLMDLHIIREVIKMGFASHSVRVALKRKLKQTGLPFFSLEAAIESILHVMDEETKRTITGCEYITSQARKMASCRRGEDSPLREVSPPRETPERTITVASEVTVLQPLPALSSSASPPLRSSTPASQVEIEEDPTPLQRFISYDSGTSSSSETELEPVSPISETPTSNPERSQVNPVAQVPELTVSVSVSNESTEECLMEADEVIEKAASLLAPSTGSSASSQSSDTSQDSGFDRAMETEDISDEEEKATSKNIKKPLSKTEVNLAQELEQLKDTRTCKVCMDKEMDIVFLPCTHMVTCSSCAVALAACPVCRKDIQYALKPIIT